MAEKIIEKMRMVHDDDLDVLLDSLGVLSKFKAGELKCDFCNVVISFENLHSMFPDSGAIKFTCSEVECVKLLMTKLEEKNYGNPR